MAETGVETERSTESGIPVERVYDASAVEGLDLAERLGEPGASPSPAASTPRCTASKPWTMRQYAGFATAEETNARFRYLLAAGAPGLSTAFDLPTQLGMDSDDPLAAGEVGRVGVAIDSVEDMARLFDGIPLDRVSTSMTINAPGRGAAAALPAGGRGGRRRRRASCAGRSRTTCSRSTSRAATTSTRRCPRCGSPPTRSPTATPSCRRWNTISISGYHIREAGSTAVQEVAFTLANGIAYVEAALAAGLDVNRFGPRLSFFFNAHNNLMEEVAKFRAARSLWAHIMRDRFGATEPRAMTPALPRPDRRQHADRPAAAQQRRAGGGAGAGGRPRRRPVDPLQRLRRGARPAHRGVGQARAAHPAGHRRRVGHHATRSTRWAAATTSSA